MSRALAEEKSQLRKDLSRRRKNHWYGLGAAGRHRFAELAIRHLPTFEPGSVVAGFWPLPGEFETPPILNALSAAGHPIVLPVTGDTTEPLSFRDWAPGDRLVPGKFGVQEPPDHASERLPDIVLAPLLAFDRRGYRLGYGGGFYDRTIDQWRTSGHSIRSIGLGFQMQEVEHVPREAYDQVLDGILTETGYYPAMCDENRILDMR